MLQSTLNTTEEGEKKIPFTRALEAFYKLLHHKQPVMRRPLKSEKLANECMLGRSHHKKTPILFLKLLT